MSNLNRVLWSGLVLGIAACGDSVTVTQPPEPVPGIRSVTVTPDGASLVIGATLQMIAAVTADPGAATPTIAWTSSEPAKATVDPASGLVKGVAAGAVAIKATATSGTSTGQGAASITVTAVTQTVATISIGSVEQGGQPANLAGLEDQVDVRLNLDRKDQVVTKIQLLVDGAVVSEQAFASPPANASVPEKAVEQVVMSWMTEDFNPTTGVAKFLNGEHALSAKVLTAQSGGGSASPTVKVVTANRNFIALSLKFENGAAGQPIQGTQPVGGTNWWNGDAVVTGVPVFYDGGVTIAQVVFAPSGGLFSKTVKVAPYTARWNAASSVNPGGGSNNFSQFGWTVTASATVNGAGTGLLGTVKANYDNGDPNPGSLRLTMQKTVVGLPFPLTSANNPSSTPACCTQNWAGRDYAFANGHTSATSSGSLAGAVDPSDAGSGVKSTTYYIGSAALSNDDIIAQGTPVKLGSDYASETTNNASLSLVAVVSDFMGNTEHTRLAANAVNPLTTLGIDKTDPTGGLATTSAQDKDGSVLGAALPTPFSFLSQGTDNLSGFSGYPTVRNVITNFGELGPDNAPAGECFSGLFDGVSACLRRVSLFGTSIDPTIGPEGKEAYYTFSAFVRDQAGNRTADFGATTLYDITPPVVTSVIMSPSPNATNGGAAATLAASMTDNLDLWRVRFFTAFTGVTLPGGNYLRNGTATSGQFGLPLERVGAGTLQTTVVRSLQASDPVTGVPTGAIAPPDLVHARGYDMAGNTALNQSSFLGGFAMPANAGAVNLGVSSFIASLPGTFLGTLCNGGTGCPAGTPLTVTISLRALGLVAFAGALNPAFQNSPFARADLFYTGGAGPFGAVTYGQAAGPSVSANIGNTERYYDWSITFDAAGFPATGALQIYFVGRTPFGDALYSSTVVVAIVGTL